MTKKVKSGDGKNLGNITEQERHKTELLQKRCFAIRATRGCRSFNWFYN